MYAIFLSSRTRERQERQEYHGSQISPHTEWPSIEEIPTRIDLEKEVIEVDDDDDNDYEPPGPAYISNARPESREPREEGPRAPNIFTDSARGREIPVQRVNPFSRGRRGFRKNFLGKVRPM